MSLLSNSPFARESGLKIQMERFYDKRNSQVNQEDPTSATKTISLSIDIFPIYGGLEPDKAFGLHTTEITQNIEIPTPVSSTGHISYLSSKEPALKKGLMDKVGEIWRSEIEKGIKETFPQTSQKSGNSAPMTHVGVNAHIVFTRLHTDGSMTKCEFNTDGSIKGEEMQYISTYHVVAL